MIILFDSYVKKNISPSGIKKNIAEISHIFSKN